MTSRRPRPAPAGAQGVANPPVTQQLLKDLLDQNFAEIGRADGKAGILLALTVSLIGLLLNGTGGPSVPAEALRWTAGTTTTAALLTVLLALLPRRTPTGTRTLAYFGDVQQWGHRSELVDVVRDSGAAPETRLLRAVEGTSRIAQAKNRCIRLAITLLVPAATSSLVALLAC